MQQEHGWIGRQVGNMVRRTVRRRFRNVYWRPVTEPVPRPAVFVANHHGWHDGYLMFHLVTRLGVVSVDWIAEYDAFPLFGRIGGMPFPPGDLARRAATVRRTVSLMRNDGRSLVLFAEADLHRPPEVRPFGRALEVVAEKVPGATVFPVAVHYDMSLHERPEAFLAIGEPVAHGERLAERARDAVESVLADVRTSVVQGADGFEVLAAGTPDVNERWDLRRAPGRGRR